MTPEQEKDFADRNLAEYSRLKKRVECLKGAILEIGSGLQALVTGACTGEPEVRASDRDPALFLVIYTGLGEKRKVQLDATLGDRIRALQLAQKELGEVEGRIRNTEHAHMLD